MGKPASRVTDTHVCPMLTALVPHVGGPVMPPAAVTVVTCGQPQARVGDLCTCATGPPAPIAMGSTTVMVCGQPAARLGDSTGHGGALVSGAPTVMIGG